MLFDTHEYVRIGDGPILQILYADEEKVVGLKILCTRHGYFYGPEPAFAVSNKKSDYDDTVLQCIKKVSKPEIITESTNWWPVRIQYDI